MAASEEAAIPKLRPIVALYGAAHVPYARALLASLRGGPRPILVWDDLAAEVRAALARDADLMHVALPVAPDRVTRVGRKLLAWRMGFHACQDGECVVFLDADTLVLGSLADVGADAGIGFDVAGTRREDRRWPVNSGVVFARVASRVGSWLDDWHMLTSWILGDGARVQRAIDGWGGADQAALAASLALHGGHEGLRVAWLDADRWNADWTPTDPGRVVIAHLKGALPQLLDPNGDAGLAPHRREIFARWRTFHEEATG